MTGPDERPPARRDSTQLLLDLVNDTLDPGYRAAARRRSERSGGPADGRPGGRTQSRPWWDRPAVALGCLLAGFVVVVGYVHTHRSEPEVARAQQALVQRVRAAQSGADDLAGRADRVQRAVARLQASALPTDGTLAQALRAEQLAAGVGTVHGPGVMVTLREPPTPTPSSSGGRAGTTPIGATNILTDRDVRSVVNELWHDGAEAIAVNGIRLTPTTAIRFAGQAVLVDYQPIASPYVVDAVGDADVMSTRFAQSDVASRYQTLVSADGIGFSVTEEGTLVLPASAPASPRYASSAPAAASAGDR